MHGAKVVCERLAVDAQADHPVHGARRDTPAETMDGTAFTLELDVALHDALVPRGLAPCAGSFVMAQVIGPQGTIGPTYDVDATTASYHFFVSPLGFDPMWNESPNRSIFRLAMSRKRRLPKSATSTPSTHTVT